MKAVERGDDPTHLGSYQILRKLARGGMAEVLLARTLGKQGFERIVVLKQILPKFAERQRYVDLFLDEARLAASLNHANIVQVYDIGMEAGSYFFAMEYVHGQDVRTILHRAWRDGTKFPVRFAVQVAIQIAAALQYAHEKRRADGTLMGVVHRDVSPSNVLVSYDGAIKLIDFGVAKASTSTTKTRTGTLKGKIAYMSPEQAKGMPLDRRSDLFSLGIVLWEMVTTQRLFKGDNDLQTLQLIIHQTPKRPRDYQPECSPELERVILKAVAQNIDDRYATTEALLMDLEAVQANEGMGHSASALGAYMAALFRPEVASWRDAKQQGVDLAEHLTHVGDLTTPVSDSEFIDAVDLEALADDDADDDDDGSDVDGAHHADAEPTSSRPPARPATPMGTEPPTVSLRPIDPPPATDETIPAAVDPLPDPGAAPSAAPMPRPTPVPGGFPAPHSATPWTVVASAPPSVGPGGHTLSTRLAAISRLYDAAPELDPEVAVRVERRGLIVAACVVVGIVVVAIVAAIAG